MSLSETDSVVRLSMDTARRGIFNGGGLTIGGSTVKDSHAGK